jgi:tetratricopeptide (TPR) repeat protein
VSVGNAVPDARWDACLGKGLPPAAERELQLAGLAYQDDQVAEAHLRAAQEAAPEHVAVEIGWYRFLFYKGRLHEALEVAERCLSWAARELGLAREWRQVQIGDASFGDMEAVLPRFYLFTLKGYAYLLMRVGELERGRVAIQKLLELDPDDKFGGNVLLKVLERGGRDDDD